MGRTKPWRRGPGRPRRVFKYGHFRGMDPVCPARVKEYPDLEAVRDATAQQRRAMDPGDLSDAQHQWVYTCGVQVMQWCHEDGCEAVRPVPLASYPWQAQRFILQQYLSKSRSTRMEK